jgi:hypothetical protein
LKARHPARRLVIVLALAAIAAACGGDGEAPIAIATVEAMAPGELVGGSWRAPRDPKLVDPTIVGDCGDPVHDLGLPNVDVRASVVSPVLEAVDDDGPGDGGVVRTAAIVYETDPAARRAVEAVRAGALRRCLLTSVNRFLARDRAQYDFTADELPDATGESFRMRDAPVGIGDQARQIDATFEEEVIGGNDNTRRLALVVARKGPVVVTALVAVSSQTLGGDSGPDTARRLTIAALQRAG